MFCIDHARQILPTVWHIPDFLLDPDQVRASYRANQQPWRSEYANRLLTPWGSNPQIEQLLQALPPVVAQLTGHAVTTQVGYASLDLSDSQIMMHRLHPDIRAYVQIYMGQDPAPEMSSVFCTSDDVNQNRAADYADITEFAPQHLVTVKYRPNHAWIMLNQPRCFFGTTHKVAPNTVRETLCFHFASELPAST